jgi:soluble lytic murein transglycosylase-like protein
MYRYNPISLQFELDEQKQFKYDFFKKATIGVVITFLVMVLYFDSNAQKQKDTILVQKSKINALEMYLKHLQATGQDSATEYADFRRSLPLKLTDAQERRLKHLYFKYKNVINKHNVPNNIVWYIAFKESGFNVNAKNSKSSASGLFQFISSTWQSMCKRNGMDISGRFNEAKQVEILCVYLDYLYDKYGDWSLCHKEYAGNVMVYKLPYYK